jgi:hypothetical protein
MTKEIKSPSRAYLFRLSVVGTGEDLHDAFEHALYKLEADMGDAMHGPVEWRDFDETDQLLLFMPEEAQA